MGKKQTAGTTSGVDGWEVAEPRDEQQEATNGAAEENEAEVEEVSEMEVPLVRKRRRLVRVGDVVLAIGRRFRLRKLCRQETWPNRGRGRQVVEKGRWL